MNRFFVAGLCALSAVSMTAQDAITIGTPSQICEAMAAHVSGSDTLRIRLASGIHHIDAPIKITASPSRPVVIEGDADDMPVVSGGMTIGGWQVQPDGVWVADVPEVSRYGAVFEQLFFDNHKATRARTPDNGWFMIDGCTETVHTGVPAGSANYATQRMNVKPEYLDELKGMSPAELADVVVMFYHKWDNTRKYLAFAEPDSGYIYTAGEAMKPWNKIDSMSRFFIENYRGALTAPGEWYLDKNKGKLYYIPMPGENPTTTVAYAPMMPVLLDIEGTKSKPVEGITFRNIAFKHSSHVMPKSGNAPAQAAHPVNTAVSLNHARNIVFDNCCISNTGNSAIWFKKDVHDSALKHSMLCDLGAGGVKIGEFSTPESADVVTTGIVVDNNIITRTGQVFPCGTGVTIFHASDNKVTHNEIADLLYSGVSVGWVWGYAPSYAKRNEVGYNHIHHIGWGELSDMGAVYTLGLSEGTRVHHNSIHHVYSYDYGGWGLYTDEGSTGVVMDCNLVYGCKSGGFHQHYGKENLITNNILAYGVTQQIQFTRPEEHKSFIFTNNIVYGDNDRLMGGGAWKDADIDMDRNCFFNPTNAGMSSDDDAFYGMAFAEWKKKHDSHSIVTDPGFADAANGDFRMRNNKVARRIGFKPFSLDEFGVYGSGEWIAKAQMPQERIEEFDRIVREKEESAPALFNR